MDLISDMNEARSQFPILERILPNGKKLIYLDNAATSQKPSSVIDAMNEYYTEYNSNVHRAVHTLSGEATEAFELARKSVADWFGLPTGGMVLFTSGTTDALNLCALGWAKVNLSSGDAIVLTEMEHHSNIVPWQMLAKEKDLELRWVDVNPETYELDLDDYVSKINGAKLACIIHTSNVLGTRNPVENLVKIAHEKEVVVVCDNTFASPYVIKPLDWGVDIVVESATKFIGGHNDALGGVIAMKSKLLPDDFMEQIRWNTMVKWGSPLSPFNAWVLLRGIQTLSVRLERQCKTAMILAKYFSKHPKVKRVWYPGLESHPQHHLAKKQMPNFGGMLTFEVNNGDDALTVLDNLELACFAASLGGVRTTTQIPATMAFLDIPEEERQEMGIYQGMIRVSTGLEDPDDLIADFEEALMLIK